MRDVAASLLAYLREENPRIVLLVEIATGLAATPTLRYASTNCDLVWGVDGMGSPLTWSRRPFDPGEIRVESQDNADGPTLELGDVDRVFRDLVAAGAPLAGQSAICRLTVEQLCLSSSAENTAIRDDFLIDHWEMPEGKIRLALKPYAALFDVLLPRTTMTRVDFPGIPRDATYL